MYFFCVFFSVLLRMEIHTLVWTSLVYLPLHPIRSQIMDLVRFIVLNIEVVLLHSVLFPVQAKLPELLHICFTEHCSKIFKVKSFMRSTRATQLVLSLVLDYVHCSAEGMGSSWCCDRAVSSVHTLAGVRRSECWGRAKSVLVWLGWETVWAQHYCGALGRVVQANRNFPV